MKPTSMFTSVIAVVVLLVLSNSLYIIKEIERGVKLQFGEVVEADLQPGLHFKIPFVNTIRKFDARVQTLDTRPQSFLTLEKKRLVVDSYVKWIISDTSKFYTATSGDSYRAADLLSTRIETSLRNQFGTRTLTEVVSGEREEVMDAVIATLSKISEEELGLRVVDVRVKRIDLPSEVSNSVYERMRTERERLARELRSRGKELAEGIRADADRQSTVILANAYRESEVTRGEGDAQAASIYANAYNKDPEFYSFHRSLMAYRESFKSGSDVLLLKPDSEFFRYLQGSKP
ncbi:protease modulator HflC [Marinobacterium sp. LSUCC0821]|jgi:membrane protease subunit HflC|uniref:protease modulator HflC n=1 Tax=Marinobacterium sp. LSUCC0821 TaxID=2668067 RepID=UPI001451AFE1|nr:protease modulator HflC [Marinobacterium sp. LSUCC0821]QJD70309.1 protease modulator HflC [Marinobacterium sp. LSUCC0821]